jgi:protocatechuate 3,4-dioxygenase beta subunit
MTSMPPSLRNLLLAGLLRYAALFVLLCAGPSAPLLAQSAPQAAPAAGAYRIAGKLVNSVTGEAVRQATVEALDEENQRTVQSVITDSDGNFAFSGLPAGKYPLTASKRGFQTGFYDDHEGFNSAIVTGPGQDTEHLLFRLTPSAMVHGVVTGDDGEPVDGATVMLFRRPPGMGRDFRRARGPEDRINQAGSQTTDDTGAYEFANLAPGDYVLAVQAQPWYALHPTSRASRSAAQSQAAAALDVAYPLTYFDSTTDASAATPITLAGGSRQEADINLHAVPALRLTVPVPRRPQAGMARAELRQMVFGAQVSAVSEGFINALQTGTVEFTGLAPGHYELWQGDPPRVASLDATTSGQIDASGGTPTFAVAGNLRTSSGQPLPNELSVSLYPTDASGHSETTASASGGHFQFEHVPAGTWNLFAASSGLPIGVLAVQVDGSTRAGSAVVVADHPLNLAVTIAVGETHIKGFARKDGKGFAGALVVLVPRNPAAFEGLVRRDQSDSDGSFSMYHVAPGQYTLVAIQGAWDLLQAGPDALARYLPGGTNVTVKANSGALLTLPAAVTVQPR